MITFQINGVREYNILHYHELLPDTWKMVKSWWHDRLRYTMAKSWNCGPQIVSFSAWIVGRISLACSIEYEKTSSTCKITIDKQHYFGWSASVEEKFAEALKLVLKSSSDYW